MQPVLQANCARSCHQPQGGDGGNDVSRNRLVLTGDAEGDFNVVLTMVNDTCNAGANPLLLRPSTVPHPAGAVTQTAPVLPAASAGYATIANWIARGCPTP